MKGLDLEVKCHMCKKAVTINLDGHVLEGYNTTGVDEKCPYCETKFDFAIIIVNRFHNYNTIFPYKEKP